MTTEEGTTIIFHRSKQNAEESITNQKAFLESYKKIAKIDTVIDYATGDSYLASKISEIGIKLIQSPNRKVITIINSHLSDEEFNLQYNMYCYLKFLERVNIAELYLMDSKGSIYKEIKNIEDCCIGLK